MLKIIDKAVLSDGTKIQLEDWHSENSEKYPDLYGYMIGAYPKAKNTGKWGWVRTGETFRLSIGRNEYAKYTDDMVLADYSSIMLQYLRIKRLDIFLCKKILKSSYKNTKMKHILLAYLQISILMDTPILYF